ncbi:hypothetical protein LSTR_LSTR016190 [Laodelphax striatellus]|uniref:Uncharacterized protein n=1 Tax=Laodelphax striatellus TaxID=195883 RepID=A0A482WUI1_LAOST|nr:hypothetical protein LSTR_LSTR016190 [Laodelphax striatellus]
MAGHVSRFAHCHKYCKVMDQISKVIEPGRQFAKDSLRLVKRCTKPDRKGW